MPLCPQVTITPITVTSTNMVQTSVIAANAPATTEQLTTVNASAVAAQTAAAAALAEANIAYTAAIGSLQPSANTIVNASNQMTAINGGGITVYSGASSTSGARVVLNSAGLAGFNSGGTATFSVSASTGAAVFSGDVTGSTITGGSLNIAGNAIINTSGFLTATGATITGTITATSGSFTGTITATGGTIGGFTIGSTNLFAGSNLDIQSTGSIVGSSSSTLFYGYANIGGGSPSGARLQVLGNTELTGTLSVTGTATVQGVFTATDAGTNTNTNTPNAWLSTGGVLRRSTASSQRYKENITDIRDVAELDPKKMLEIPVRAFSYKSQYIKEQDDRAGILMPGLIAEEVDAIYPLAADYEGGNVENINDRAILVNLLALVQDLYKEIALLKGE